MDDHDYIDIPGQDSGDDAQSSNQNNSDKSQDFMPHTQHQEWVYRGEGVGRRESTFGDTPRGSAPQPEQPRQGGGHSRPWEYPQTDVVIEPKPKKKKKNKSSKLWIGLLIGGGVGAVVAVLVGVLTFSLMTGKMEQLRNKFEDAGDRIQSAIGEEDETHQPQQSTPDTAVPDSQEPTETVPSTQPPVQADPGTVMTPAQVYAHCVNSVVAINGTSNQGSSSGSGFIISDDGYVVTNYHVVEGQSRLEVSTCDGKDYQAEYIGGNEANDIALIKMNATGLSPVTVGDSTQLVVGEQVAAIGNPLGELASTLTVGYISAKDRIVATDGTQINMLQTDAAINPGNSGGPLFNMKGEVIGITSAKYSGTTTSGATIEGIGFAIPIDDVWGMINDLRDYGYITGGYLGISASDVDADAAELYGLPKGVLVREVTSNSCAEKAGMKVQDIIVNLGGHAVNNLNDLSRALNKFEAGETVDVTVYRGGREMTLSVTLDERPKELSDASTNTEPTTPSQPSPGGSIEDWFDFFLP